ncbi:MAG: hypothetical protein M1827_004247 [Pycnora praestabilis]|nr:MAG: hypothetical protein M1827_004247 [Pycnora praestabilis]
METRARAKSFVKGRDGFLITAPTELTKEQIQDLREQSRQWEMQAANRMGNSTSEEEYINRPIQVSQRERRGRWQSG